MYQSTTVFHQFVKFKHVNITRYMYSYMLYWLYIVVLYYNIQALK